MEWSKNTVTVARINALGVGILILAGSSVPGHHIPQAFELTPDKLIHCAEYWVLGSFVFRWVQQEFRNSNIWLLTLLIGSVFGMMDENYQRLIPGRTPDFWDWVLDTIGIVLAILTAPWIWSRLDSIKKRLSQNSQNMSD